MCPFFLSLLGVLLVLLGGRAAGHVGFESDTEVRVYPDRTEVATRTNALLAWRLLEDKAPPDADEAGFARAMPALEDLAKRLIGLSTPAGNLSPRSARVEHFPNDEVLFVTAWPRPAAWPLRIHARFLPLLGMLESATVRVFDLTDKPMRDDTEPVTGAVLTAGHPALDVNLGPHAPAGDGVQTPPDAGENAVAAGFGTFLLLGIRHIITGYDHLLFLFGLLLGCRRVKPMLGIITAFTLAHSLTLGMAATNVVRLPSALVEATIAASIVAVGVENLWRGDDLKARIWVTFAFGLVHGFGFAGALRETGLGLGAVPLLVPLAGFNLGVEIGQITVAAFLLPLLLALRRREALARVALPALSVLVVLIGAFWLVQRTF